MSTMEIRSHFVSLHAGFPSTRNERRSETSGEAKRAAKRSEPRGEWGVSRRWNACMQANAFYVRRATRQFALMYVRVPLSAGLIRRLTWMYEE